MSPLGLLSALALVTLTAAACLSTGTAQVPTPPAVPEEPALFIAVADIADPVAPVTGFATAPITVSYRCEAFYASGGIAETSQTELTLTVRPKESYVLAALPPPNPITIAPNPQTCAPGSQGTAYSRVSVGFTRTAPAFQGTEVAELTVRGQSNLGNNHTAFTNLSAAAGYYGDLSAVARNKVARAMPGDTAEWTVSVRNVGNTQSRFDATLAGVPKAWGVAPTVDPPTLGPGEQTEIAVQLQLPATLPDVEDGALIGLTLTVQGRDVERPELVTQKRNVPLSLEVEQPAKQEDSPAPLLAPLAALVAVALARGRREPAHPVGPLSRPAPGLR